MRTTLDKSIMELEQHLRDPLYRNSYFLMASSLINSALGFLFWIVVARYYPTREVGLATALISTMGLLAMLSKFGFDFGLIRFLPEEEDKKGLVNSCASISAISSLMLSIIFIVGLNLWSPALLFVRKNFIFLFSFIIFTILFSIFGIQYNAFIALRNTKFSFIQNATYQSLKIPLSIIFVGFGVLGIFSSVGVAILIALIISIFFSLPKLLPEYRLRFTIKRKVINEILHFSFGNYIADIFYNIPSMILPILIVNVLSPEMGAYFYIAWAIAWISFMISDAMSMSLFAEGSHDPERLRENMMKAVKFIFLLLVPILFGIFFFGDKILLLFGRDYSEYALKLLQVLAVSSIPVAINTIYVAVKRVQKEIKIVILIYVFIATFTIGVGYILMMKVGLIGIGMGWLLSQGIIVIGVLMKNLHRSKLPFL